MISPPARSVVEIGAMYMGGAFTLKDFGVAAEAAGFDSVWVGDHVAHYVDGIAGLGILAGCTETVTVGTNVLVLPFRPPAVVAKGVLTAMTSARRRVVMCVGAGGDVPAEFALAGADKATRGRYTDEALEVIAGLWSGRPFSYHGTWSSFDEILMEPTDGSRPEIWVGGRSTAAVRRAATRAVGYNPYLISPDQVAERYDALRALAAGERIDLDGYHFAATTFHVPGRDEQEAFERGYPRCGFRGVSERHFRSSYLLGNQESCRRNIERYLAAGVTHLVIGCAPGGPHQLEEFVHAFAELIPEIRPERTRDDQRAHA